jgi:hypothetical protein
MPATWSLFRKTLTDRQVHGVLWLPLLTSPGLGMSKEICLIPETAHYFDLWETQAKRVGTFEEPFGTFGPSQLTRASPFILALWRSGPSKLQSPVGGLRVVCSLFSIPARVLIPCTRSPSLVPGRVSFPRPAMVRVRNLSVRERSALSPPSVSSF